MPYTMNDSMKHYLVFKSSGLTPFINGMVKIDWTMWTYSLNTFKLLFFSKNVFMNLTLWIFFFLICFHILNCPFLLFVRFLCFCYFISTSDGRKLFGELQKRILVQMTLGVGYDTDRVWEVFITVWVLFSNHA